MIVKACKEDYPFLIEIWESSVKATHYFLSEKDFIFYKSQLPFYFEHVDLYIFRDDSIYKGFIGVSTDSIEMLFVDDCYRGYGVGKELLLYAIRNFNKNKVDVNEQNEGTLAFYKHFGFISIGRSEHDSEGKEYPIIHLQLDDK